MCIFTAAGNLPTMFTGVPPHPKAATVTIPSHNKHTGYGSRATCMSLLVSVTFPLCAPVVSSSCVCLRESSISGDKLMCLVERHCLTVTSCPLTEDTEHRRAQVTQRTYISRLRHSCQLLRCLCSLLCSRGCFHPINMFFW